MKKITRDELTEVMNELDNKTKELSSREISEKFSKEFFSLLTVADFATLGKTKALIYALKLGYLAGKNERQSANPTHIPKNHTLKFRYDDEIEEKLRYLSEKHFVSKSEIVRKGIEIQYNEENE